jgi:hypothetical protein
MLGDTPKLGATANQATAREATSDKLTVCSLLFLIVVLSLIGDRANSLRNSNGFCCSVYPSVDLFSAGSWFGTEKPACQKVSEAGNMPIPNHGAA